MTLTEIKPGATYLSKAGNPPRARQVIAGDDYEVVYETPNGKRHWCRLKTFARWAGVEAK